jgi:hypothetical protein
MPMVHGARDRGDRVADREPTSTSQITLPMCRSCTRNTRAGTHRREVCDSRRAAQSHRICVIVDACGSGAIGLVTLEASAVI